MKQAFAFASILLALALPAETASRDVWNLSLGADLDPVAATRELAERTWSNAKSGAAASKLRVERVSESLAGRHVFLRAYIGDRPILNGGFAATFAENGAITSFHDRLPSSQDTTRLVMADEARAIARHGNQRVVIGAPELVGWLHDDGVARLAWRVVTRTGYDEYATLVSAVDGTIILTEPRFFSIDGRIFDPNPVTTLNQPSLRDNDDSADAVPDSAYSIVSVDGLGSEDSLAGAHVVITDSEAPTTTRAKPLSGLLFDRSQDEFEEVMAYVHIDRSQRYIQSLGFTGEKAIVPYAIPVDAHGAGGEDNSFYRFSTPGRGRLVFGDGGVDDAEDADVILHEYGHAIQDSIVPAGFTGTATGEPRALGEGFGDYWAFSASYSANIASGADAFCVGNWDALCGGAPSTNCGYSTNASCLRRVDGTKTMSDYIRSGGNGTEHRNGEIWSSVLREIFMDAVAMSGIQEGRRLADRTILESHFGMPPNPSFRTAAIRLLDADRRLNAGRLEISICRAMTSRGILDDEDCGAGLRGDVTLIQSTARGIAIPDNTPSGIDSTLVVSDTRPIEAVFVAVNVRHPRRGDLRLALTGPDGTAVVIQTESSDSAADIVATYGLDTQPSQPLTPFLGKSAAGTWTLNVTDNRGADEGDLLGWSLLVRFAGDLPIEERGRPGNERLHVSVTGTTPGAAGTKFVSDVRLLNIGAATEAATLFYTPSGTDGLATFRALTLTVDPGQVVALDDIVAASFRSNGTGSIEVRGGPDLVVTSRIYNDQPAGTFGQFLAARATSRGVAAGGGALQVVQLRNDVSFRSNLGISEIDGGSGEAEIRLYDAEGALISSETRTILPFSHVQFPLFGGIGGTTIAAARAEVRVTSGDARILVYGSTVDNLSGDAVLVPGALLPREASPIVVPAVIHASGANGTSWRSDVTIFNGSPAPQVVEIAYHPGAGQGPIAASFTLAPFEMRLLGDIVSGTFALEGSGSIIVSADDPSSLIVTSRAWNDAPGGSFGQFIEGVSSGAAVSQGAILHLSHLDADGTYRTNLGLTEVSGAPVTARLTLLDAAGSEVVSTTIEVGPHVNRQLNLSELGVASLRNGQARIELLAGTGRILAYASVVDNRTGDAIYVSSALGVGPSALGHNVGGEE